MQHAGNEVMRPRSRSLNVGKLEGPSLSGHDWHDRATDLFEAFVSYLLTNATYEDGLDSWAQLWSVS